MKQHNTEKISALADGELKGLSRWLTQRHLRHCPQCAAEYRRVERVRESLAACPPVIEMSDSADFFWSKIRREIEAHEQETISIPMPRLSFGDWLLVHRGALATATSGLMLALATGLMLQFPGAAGPGAVMVERVDTVIPNTVATPLKGADSDVAVIWVSGLEWTPDLDQMKECFDNLET
jgi:anti-sigma factor RsiW